MTVIEHICGSTLRLQLMSDLHIGSLHTDYKLIESELKRAEAENALIAINGDVFDAILPGDRKRYRANNLHPRMYSAGDDMIGESIRWAAEILSPYAHRILMIGDGNHDDSVARYHHIEPVKHLCILLARDSGKPIYYGGYHGFLHLKFPLCQGNTSRACGHYVIHYHHGAGGGAPVTKGAITFSRAQMWLEGVDAIWRGHTHNKQAGRDSKIVFDSGKVRAENRVSSKDVLTIRTGAYMDTYQGTTPEYLMEHGRKDNYGALMDGSALPKGGMMLELTVEDCQKHKMRETKVHSSLRI
jgi:UDP-2,3-diacylglucosamine pyrophosphatase LpxH